MIVARKDPKRRQVFQVVNYTIRPGCCPVGTWEAIYRLGLPLIGHPETTGRTAFCRAKLDYDGTVLAIWDWIDRSWIDRKIAVGMAAMTTVQNQGVS